MTIGRRSERAFGGRGEAVNRFVALWPIVQAKANAAVLAEAEARLGSVTSRQLQALSELPQDAATMRELAARLQISGAAACSLADRLVAHGLTERRTDPADRRIVRLALTARGRALAQRHGARQRRAAAAWLSRLDDAQLATFLAALEILAADETPGGARRELVEVAR